MDYLALAKSFRTEVAYKLQYRKIDSPFNALMYIAVLPFTVSYLFTMLSYYVLAFLYNCFASAVNYLEAWLKGAKKDVHPATEAVLYFVTIPFIFFSHVMLSVFAIFFYFNWFFLQCYGYVYTLGGIRWQPFINTATFDEDSIADYHPTTSRNAYTIASTVLFCVWFVLTIITVIAMFDVFDYEFLMILPYFHSFYNLVLAIVVPVIFRKTKGNVNSMLDADKGVNDNDGYNGYTDDYTGSNDGNGSNDDGISVYGDIQVIS